MQHVYPTHCAPLSLYLYCVYDAGFDPGSVMNVIMKDGHTCPLAIPPGITPGDAIQVMYDGDNDELLLFMLQGLVKDQQTYMMLRHQVNPQIEIPCEELAAKAREFGIHDTNEFFKSKVFAAHNFQLMTDQDNRRFVVF